MRVRVVCVGRWVEAGGDKYCEKGSKNEQEKEGEKNAWNQMGQWSCDGSEANLQHTTCEGALPISPAFLLWSPS